MAIKIEIDNTVKVFRPASKYFTLQELNDEVKGFVEPQKVGPIWLMFNEEKEEAYNQIASIFFSTELYGPVLIIPPQELPAEWDAMEESDYNYKAEDVDNGFLLSLQTVLKHQKLFGAGNYSNVDNVSRLIQTQEEWVYTPPEIDDLDKLDENTIDFYNQVYNYISNNPAMFEKNILFKEPSMVVKIDQPLQKRKMVQQMIEYFLSIEEYEKCAFLQKSINN